MCVAKKYRLDNSSLIDAIRECLGLAPLYGNNALPTEAERFYVSHTFAFGSKYDATGRRRSTTEDN